MIFDFDGLIVDSEHAAARGFIDVLGAWGFSLRLEHMAHLFGSTEVDHLWDERIADCTDGAVSIEAARRLDVVAARCLVLEDSVHGCDAAIAAGMPVIAGPSPVTAQCDFPTSAARADSLLEVLHHPLWRAGLRGR